MIKLDAPDAELAALRAFPPVTDRRKVPIKPKRGRSSLPILPRRLCPRGSDTWVNHWYAFMNWRSSSLLALRSEPREDHEDEKLRLMVARSYAGMSMGSLANKIGVTRGAICQAEHAGRRPASKDRQIDNDIGVACQAEHAGRRPASTVIYKLRGRVNAAGEPFKRRANAYGRLSRKKMEMAAHALGVPPPWLIDGITRDCEGQWALPDWLIAWAPQ